MLSQASYTHTSPVVTGQVHSIETCGTVDGPGLRYVIFTQGCPLRCLYCHNPDCRHGSEGKTVTVAELLAEIRSYRSYIQAPGGVTISGGEPLMQPTFVRELLRGCQQLGLHTALDTSGYVHLAMAQDVLDYVDLVLLDIKSFEPDTYTRVTGVAIAPTLQFARYLSSIRKPTWVRFVLVPGLTDATANVEGLADFVSSLNNIERVEVLPFHKMGEYKWEHLGYEYALKDTPVPTPETIARVKEIFQSRGLQVV